jgi:hypothetical protein
MNTTERSHLLSDNVIDSRRLITGLRHALDVNYGRVLESARERWERHFESSDPANACVSVRISSGKPCAGVIKRSASPLFYGTRRLLA